MTKGARRCPTGPSSPDSGRPSSRRERKSAHKDPCSRNNDADKPWTEAFIPKRGDKDFEPDPARASQQQDIIAASREALFSALSAGQRGHSSRDHVPIIWHPSLGRAHVEGPPKGVHFGSMGAQNQARKRLELYPEEALYLFERGAVEAWTEADEKHGSVPMSVQWAWAEMITSDGLTLERYQVRPHSRRPTTARSSCTGVCIPAAAWVLGLAQVARRCHPRVDRSPSQVHPAADPVLSGEIHRRAPPPRPIPLLGTLPPASIRPKDPVAPPTLRQVAT